MCSSCFIKGALFVALLCSGAAITAQLRDDPSVYGQDSSGQYEHAGYQSDPGYRRGFEDGSRRGQGDALSGKRVDPTKGENYEDAPGYNSSFGDKRYWKEQYRRGYTSGYQQAMYGGTDQRYGQRLYGENGRVPPQYEDDGGYARGFEDGMRNGQADVQHGKRKDPAKSESYEDAPGYNSSSGNRSEWKQQYRQGYLAGYERALDGGNGRLADAGRYSDADSPQYEGYSSDPASDPAFQRGYQDGMRDGEQDLRKNRSMSDITKSDHFRDAPGYQSNSGSKDQWKTVYRQGYATGYQQAWEGDLRH